jgi:hypothetical protein
MIVDLALSVTGSQLIASVLPSVSVRALFHHCGLPFVRRPIRTNVPFSTNAFADISSLSGDAKQDLRLYGFCKAFWLCLIFSANDISSFLRSDRMVSLLICFFSCTLRDSTETS